MARLIFFSLVLVLVAAVTAPGWCDDLWPAPWRGEPLTYIAAWEFETDVMYDTPASYEDMVGDGIHDWSDIWTHAHPYNLYWEVDPADPEDGRIYTTSVPGSVDFFLGNWLDDYPWKCVWVQITWGGSYGTPYVYSVFAPPWDEPIYGWKENELDPYPNHHVEHWMIPINPDREYVVVLIPCYTWVDQVIIETISSLEPSATRLSTWGSIKALYD